MTGTFFYMSPEQIEGDPIDERTDIYSLGITAYEMITGQRPFPESSIAEALVMRLREEIPDPRELVPDLPDELATFILRATRIERDERYENITQILLELEPLAQRMGLKGQSDIREQRKMMSLFLFYQDEHQLMLNQLVEDFSNELKKMGAVLRVADFKDV
jgi:serine/threonine protein kinase